MGFAKQIKRWATQQVERAVSSLRRITFNGLIGSLIALLLLGCANRSQSVRLLELPDLPDIGEERRLGGSMSEVAPPAIFLDLDELIADTRPQVVIASPKPDQTLTATTIIPQLTLRGLSIYKDKDLNLGPHLQVILDNQPAQSVYSLDEPIEFSELAPGSHTLRVLAVKPWGESFKNEEAYAQTTFHIFANTKENTPTAEQPQLVYSEPQGTYGAQPVLLDFYLNNAPLHFLAESDPEITDWRIRCDVNGQSFVFDQWQPVYLKGFKPGQNWVQLTLVDEQGRTIDNEFNSTVRLINYDPELKDTLSRLTRGELPLNEAGQLVDPNYEPPAEAITPTAPIAPVVPIEPAVEDKTEPNAIESEKPTEPDAKIVLPKESLPGSLEEPAKEPSGILEEATDAAPIDFSDSEFSDFDKFVEDRVIEEEATEESDGPAFEEAAEDAAIKDAIKSEPSPDFGEASEALEAVDREEAASEEALMEEIDETENDSEEIFEESGSPIDEELFTEDEPPTEDEPSLTGEVESDIQVDDPPPASASFFDRIQSSWRSLNTPKPTQTNESTPNIPEPPTILEPPADDFPIENPLLIPELQLSDLDELSTETTIPDTLQSPETPTAVPELALDAID